MHNWMKQLIDWDTIENVGKRILFTKIVFWVDKTKLTKTNVDVLKSAMSEYVDGMMVNGRSIKAVKEQTSDEKTLYAGVAKSTAYFKKMIKAENAKLLANGGSSKLDVECLKVEWGPRIRLYYNEPGNHPACLVSWSRKQGWEVQTQTIKKTLTDFEVGAFLRASS